MKKLAIAIAAMLMLGMADASAQGFLNKLKQKTQQAVFGTRSQDSEPEQEQGQQTDNESDMAVAQGSDIVPKRKTSTVTWDGIITPSTATTAAALMGELPTLPSAEQMARSSMEEREAYVRQIAAVSTRAEQLMEAESGCSDAEMEALRNKWENKVQDLFGLSKEEIRILNDEHAPEAKKQAVRDKVMQKMVGSQGFDASEMARFEKMSEKEKEAYIMAHPEFMQKMMAMAQNTRGMSRQVQQMTAGLNGFEARLGRLVNNHLSAMERETQHDYASIKRKYDDKLQIIYNQICSTDDAAQVDALYQDADRLLYGYRLEAAKEYRASLLRQIAETKRFAAEYAKLAQNVVDKGELPACAVGRMDLNCVIAVAQLLDAAYKDVPDLTEKPVCVETVFELSQGWEFVSWECRGYVGKVDEMKTPGEAFPLLVQKTNQPSAYGVVERGKMRLITDEELEQLNKKADARAKHQTESHVKPPYGVYTSRSGKRTVEFSKTGELIINGMTAMVPIAFTANVDRLEWLTIDGSKILKCTYKL